MATYTFLNSLNGEFAGTAGNDLFIWPEVGGSIDANDTFFGAAGIDTLRIDASVTLTFTLAQWMAGIEVIQVANSVAAGVGITIGAAAGAPDAGAITMYGGAYGDFFDIPTRGAGYNATFDAGAGNDRFLGGGGNDHFLPGSGNDTFSGGAGSDTVTMLAGDLAAGDSLIGGADNDALRLTGGGAGSLQLGGGTPYVISGFEVFDGSALSAFTFFGFSAYMQAGAALNGVPTVIGGAGNDDLRLEVGTPVATLFRPGDGADTVFGGNGNDTVELDPDHLTGADTLLASGGTGDTLRFIANGTLTSAGAFQTSGFERIELGAGGVQLVLHALPTTVVGGGSGNDRIDGRLLPNISFSADGLEGNDTLVASDAGGVFSGSAGNDSLLGGAGGDNFSGGANGDTLSGGGGDDSLHGGLGNDRLLGGAGDDVFARPSFQDPTEQGADTILGGAGNDQVVMLLANLDALDSIAGGSGHDTLLVQEAVGELSLAAAERLSGFELVQFNQNNGSLTVRIGDALAESADMPTFALNLGSGPSFLDARAVTTDGVRLFGANINQGGPADTLAGGAGNDTIGGIYGADSVLGGAGDDAISVEFRSLDAGAAFNGGAGSDVIQALDAVVLRDGTLARFAGFEQLRLTNALNEVVLGPGAQPPGATAFAVIGGSETDLLNGSAATIALTLTGLAGDDELTGGSRNDVLFAGTGSDWASGGAGADTVYLDDVDGTDAADGGIGTDTLWLNIGSGRIAATSLSGFTGFEALTLSLASGGRVVLPAGIGTAVGSGQFAVDIVSPAGGAGGALNASAVATRLDIRGGAGADDILSGSGADTIRDGAGEDRLRGRLGGDLFALTADGAADRITYSFSSEGSADIFASSAAGTVAEADTITGFNGLGDTGNLIEVTRSSLAIGSKSAVVSLAAGATLDLSAGAIFLVHATDAVAGGFASRAGIEAAFGNRVAAGDAGQAAMVVARGPGGTDAALYFVRDADGLAGLSTADTVRLLAVMVAPGTLTSADFLLA
jgi:Ca2+-binding RTX toxin-like protein